MKNRNWLNLTEYLLLVGSGVGSLATIVSQQILFTAAPISGLLLLNLVSRRRLEQSAQENTATSVAQLEHKLSGEVGSLQKHVQALPNFLDLASLRKSVLNSQQAMIADLSNQMSQLQQERDATDWRSLQQTVQRLQEQYTGLAESVSEVTHQLHQLSVPSVSVSKVEGLENAIALLKNELGNLRANLEAQNNEQKSSSIRLLQDQIAQLNRRLNQLPTPFDASSIRQDIKSLHKVVGDMAQRRDLSRLASQVEKLSQQQGNLEHSIVPLKVATAILKKQLETIVTKLPTSDESGQFVVAGRADNPMLQTLSATVATLEERLNQLAIAADTTHLQTDLKANLAAGLETDLKTALKTDLKTDLQTEMHSLVTTYLEPLQQQLAAMQEFSRALDQQQAYLHDRVSQLPPERMAGDRLAPDRLPSDRPFLEKASIGSIGEATTLPDSLTGRSSVPRYELVFDVVGGRQNPRINGCGSRAMVEQSLAESEARLILVYPYPTSDTFNPDLIRQFRAFLDRQGCLDIGWGHLGDTHQRHIPRALDRRRALDPTEKGFLYETLHELTQLKREYPDRFRFKVLGTNENFLVCDRRFAVLGAQSLPTASVVFPQAAVGLRTTDPDVIRQLVARFDDPVLESDDSAAYFNRAVTRYDLGDRPGALADYSEVLKINPSDDVALNNRALVRYDLGDRTGAIADFDQAVQHNPNTFIAYCNRGIVRAEMGDKLGAIEDYTFAIQINPDYVTAYFYRAIARTRLQNRLGAIQDYTEVIRLTPHNATAYFYRGLACLKLGERSDAVQDLQHAAHLFAEQGDLTSQQQVLNALDRLQKTLPPQQFSTVGF